MRHRNLQSLVTCMAPKPTNFLGVGGDYFVHNGILLCLSSCRCLEEMRCDQTGTCGPTVQIWGPPGPCRKQPGAPREPFGNQSGISPAEPGRFPVGSRMVPDWPRLFPARARRAPVLCGRPASPGLTSEMSPTLWWPSVPPSCHECSACFGLCTSPTQ